MRRFGLWSFVVLYILGMAVAAMAQTPIVTASSCDEQLNSEMFQKGGLIQQLAVTRAQLAVMTKERDEAKAALAKAAAKPESKKELK